MGSVNAEFTTDELQVLVVWGRSMREIDPDVFPEYDQPELLAKLESLVGEHTPADELPVGWKQL